MKYIFCVELYNMIFVLLFVVIMCVKYIIMFLIEVLFYMLVFEKMLVKICIERVKIMEILVKERIEKGNNLVLKLFNYR